MLKNPNHAHFNGSEYSFCASVSFSSYLPVALPGLTSCVEMKLYHDGGDCWGPPKYSGDDVVMLFYVMSHRLFVDSKR